MERETVLDYFDSGPVVEHYARAAVSVGLWRSEERVFTRLFGKDDTLLELGCGAGRIAFGLNGLGYRNVLGIDYSRGMIKQARHLAQVLDRRVPFRVGDATDMEFEDGLFDGAIFGFNGLMQIPGAANRARALREIFRVIRPGAWFVFTAHDRENPRHRKFWEHEKLLWRRSRQKPELDDFGDRFEPDGMGELYIHVPTIREMEGELKAAGFRIEANAPRSSLANEPPEVRAFSDECRFWVVQRPEEERG
jgi:SAM-dependent methyltransferase